MPLCRRSRRVGCSENSVWYINAPHVIDGPVSRDSNSAQQTHDVLLQPLLVSRDMRTDLDGDRKQLDANLGGTNTNLGGLR